ncbi:MAG: T9SS type A sorting domain-containing protein [Candidatus Marinimicrobia bacterium]|nr:T9SS type A sorting domain-containing protein [Candidatus Neomarinimicrobiota bacterium]MBT7884085.1 T9SS type A sorting domain-containing protein [Candidatus Neomarinimicrobiota bacterium]
MIACLFAGRVTYDPRLSIFYPISLNHINLAIMMIHLLILPKAKQIKQIIIPGFPLLILFTIWMIINSLFFSHYPQYALSKILSLCLLTGLPIIVVYLRHRLFGDIVLIRLLFSIALLALIMSIMGIIKLILNPEITRLSVLRGGPISMSRIMGYGIITIYFLHKGNFFPKWISYFNIKNILGLMLLVMIFTFTKGPAVSLFCVWLIYRIRNEKFKNIKNLILAVALVVLTILFSMDVIRQTMNSDVSVWYGSYITRIEHIRNAVFAFMQNPLFGIGVGNFSIWGDGWLYPHNIIIEILCETGLIGFCLFSLLIIIFFKSGYHHNNWIEKAFYLLTIFIFLNQMVSSDIVGARFLWFYLFICLMINHKISIPDKIFLNKQIIISIRRMKVKLLYKSIVLIPIFSMILSQLSISNLDGVEVYIIDFDSTVTGINEGQYSGIGFQSTPLTGQLDSDGIIATGLSDGDMIFGDTITSGDFARGTDGSSPSNGVTTGGIYAFEHTVGDFAFGIQPGGSDFTPGELILKIQNSTGYSVTHITLEYEVWIFNDQNRSNSISFSHSADNLSYTDITSLDLISPEAADDETVWVKEDKAIWIQNLAIPDGGYYYFRWTGADVSGSGSRDEFAIDDISISIGTALDLDVNMTPPNFSILNSYPNPFNPKVTINYQLPAAGIASIFVTDINGRLIQKLLDDYQTLGNHQLIWNACASPSGLYIIHLRINDQTSTQKITLIK